MSENGREIGEQSAMRWLNAAYSATLAEGHYTQSLLQGMPGAQVFHLGAKRLGLAEPVGARNRVISESPPTDADASALLDFYKTYTSAKSEQYTQLDRIERKLDALLGMWSD